MTPEQIAAALELARESRTYVVLGGPMLNRLADAVQALAAELAVKDAEIARLCTEHDRIGDMIMALNQRLDVMLASRGLSA